MRVVPLSSVPPSDSARGSRKEKPPVVSITIGSEEGSEDDNSSSVYCSLPHSSSTASSSSSPRRGWCRRLLYAYPRLCLAVVLLGTSVGTGAYSAYHLAQWTLHLTGARHALAVARTQLVATEITLRSVAACGVSQVPSRAVAVRARIEQGVAPWNETLEAYAARVNSVKTNVTCCASRDRERLERVLAPNASTAPAARACLMDTLEKTLARYTATPSTSWHVGLRRFQKLVKTRKTLADISWTRQNDTATVLALAANASSDLAAIVTTSLDELESIVATSLKALAIPEIHVPDVPVSAALETFLGVTPIGASGEKTPLSLVTGKQLLKTLRGIAGVDASLRLALDVLEKSFREVIVLVKKLDEQSTKVREEVTEIQTTLQVHATESLARFRNATATLKHAVAVQTRATVDAFASTAIDLLRGNRSRDLDDQVWKVLARWEDDDGEQERIPRDVLVDPIRAPWRDRVASPVHVTFDALEETLARGPDKGVVEQDTHYDKAVVRASLYDVSSVLVTIILTWDFLTRLGWFLGRLIRLLTESYSDLDPVDIRDNGSISTLIDVWGVLKCRHDLLTVLDAILTEGSYVVQTAVHFVLWVLFEIAGTLGLVAWHETIADRCRPRSGQIDSSAATPAALVTYIRAWFGGGSVQALSPMAAVHKQMARFDKAFDADEKAWRKQVHAAARVQSAVMDGLLLQRRFLLDLRENLARCGIEDVLLEDGEELSWCSTMPIERAESISAWESSAADAFRHERLEANFDAGSTLAACVAPGRALTGPPDQLVGRLDHAHGCLLDQTLYLGAAGWWMVVVILLALRLVSRMVTKAAGMVFWRYLSADRVEVLAYSDESGAIQAREQLPKAIRRHLRNIRWRVTARAVGVALGISSVVVVGVHVLPSSAMEPIL